MEIMVHQYIHWGSTVFTSTTAGEEGKLKLSDGSNGFLQKSGWLLLKVRME